MMLLHLVKKDILIAKKFVFATMILIIAIPLFISAIDLLSFSNFLPFLYAVVLGELVLLQSISQEEAKYPKAPALLCAMPYSRSTFVKAKYALFLFIFAYCCVTYTILLAISKSNILDLNSILIVLLCSVLIYGVYMPIEIKYGNVKAKFFFMIVVLTISWGPAIYFNLFANINIDLTILTTIPLGIQNIVLAIASIVIFCISMFTSIKIFEKKEL